MKKIAKSILPDKAYLHALDIYRGFMSGWKQRGNGLQKPVVINFNANDICNSKCTMCNIWTRKKDTEISPDEFAQILSDPLYSEVKHIGVTGGEPTLRDDLPALYDAACRTLPNLKGMSSITNAIRAKDVIQRLEEAAAICTKYGKSFSVMVSLDGYGEMHDKVRGREGNFESALQVIRHFKNNTNIPVTVGCTITKDNVWYVEDLWDFLREEGIYGRFRVAEYIQRLYNDDLTDKIRAFDEDEKYHLALFFKKIELVYEQDPMYQRTYRSIHQMLLGGKRKIACPYQSEGIVLDCRGNIAYCAPKSDLVGNGLETSSWQIYQDNIAARNAILDHDCESCIHDYHAPATKKETQEFVNRVFWKNMILKGGKWPYDRLLSGLKVKKTSDEYTVLVTGWYGTETVGDKAILGGIINHYLKEYENVRFQVTSLYPFVTVRTMKELKVEADVIPVYDRLFYEACANADEIVMGGGPLMGMSTLNVPLKAFQVGKRFKRKNVVFGCGIGPIDEDRHEQIVKEILLLADEIKLRDQTSVEWGTRLTGRNDIQRINDPAYEYVEETGKTIAVKENKKYLACFIREWPKDYSGGAADGEFEDMSVVFEEKLANTIKKICKEKDVIPAFYSMHNFVVGNDDRDFYRAFIRKYFKDEPHHLELRPSTVDSIIEAMKSAQYCLSMRFHSVVFAYVLKTNFFAIDYTNGGKITSFLNERNLGHQMIRLQDFAEGEELDLATFY